MNQPDMFYLLKRDLYECPDHMGYTGIRDKAGMWSREYIDQDGHLPIFEKYDRRNIGNYALPSSVAPEFTHACFDDLALAHVAKQRDRLLEALRPFVEISEIILGEAPAEATDFTMFRDCEGCEHVISLDGLRSAVSTYNNGGNE